MDGRHRTPWPDRPCSSLPSVAWWTGQGNWQEMYLCKGLEDARRVPQLLQHPGSPPARYRLTPSSPPRSPVPGQAPSLAHLFGGLATLFRAHAMLSGIPLQSLVSIAITAGLVCRPRSRQAKPRSTFALAHTRTVRKPGLCPVSFLRSSSFLVRAMTERCCVKCKLSSSYDSSIARMFV